MSKRIILAFILVAVVAVTGISDANAGMNFGAGLHYLHAMGDIDTDNLDLSKESFGILGSLQFAGPLLKFEGNLEYIFDYIGTGEGMVEPSAYALVGGLIYGGLGIGIGSIDGEWTDPWYALRGGVELPLGGMGLDMYASYRFWSDEELEATTGDDLDSITFAAVLRFGK